MEKAIERHHLYACEGAKPARIMARAWDIPPDFLKRRGLFTPYLLVFYPYADLAHDVQARDFDCFNVRGEMARKFYNFIILSAMT
ncbi:hypothetical protein ABID23_001451 [Bartonella silvatica]|uniref:Uncharacterized protein n=1 Tax=Bartonella silvatica TaxID=357760 RepID=A0ABV2HII4_9HYPH